MLYNGSNLPCRFTSELSLKLNRYSVIWQVWRLTCADTKRKLSQYECNENRYQLQICESDAGQVVD